MDDIDEDIERRIDLAVTLTEINGKLGNIEKYQDSCAKDRNALFKRMKQIDEEMSDRKTEIGIIDTKQKGIIRGIWIIGLGFIGLIGKMFWKIIHGQ